MKLSKFKEFVELVGLQKAMLLVDGEEVVDSDGTPVDIEAINLEANKGAGEDASDDAEDAKSIALAVCKEIKATMNEFRDNAKITGGDVRLEKNGGFKSMSEWGLAVAKAESPNGEVDERLVLIDKKWGAQTKAPSNTNRTDVGPAAGYLAPPDMRDQVWSMVMDDDGNNLLSRVDSTVTNRGSVEMPCNQTTPWGTDGIQASWKGEVTQRTGEQTNLEQMTVKLHTLTVLVNASDELLSDAPMLNQLLTTDSARAINWKANDAIINGTGVGQPQGILTSGSTVTVAKEGGQSADTIVLANVLKMRSRMLLQAGSLWLANSDTIPQLGQLVDPGNNAVFVTNAADDVPDSLSGRPLFYSESCDTLGDLNDIVLFNPQGYFVAIKSSGIDFASSIHLFFDYGTTSFRWTFRMGGRPKLSTPITPNLSAHTKSYGVNLAARA